MSGSYGLTAEREAVNLFHHGTKPSELTARNIYQAAARDVEALRVNGQIEAARNKLRREGYPKKARTEVGPKRPYGFMASHVKGATSAADVLEAAIKGRLRALKSPTLDRLRLYHDADKLHDALRLARTEATWTAPRKGAA